MQGINAWCMSNLLWSLVKLEVAGETSHVYALALAMAVSSAPLVIYFLKECSGQVRMQPRFKAQKATSEATNCT